MKVKTIYGIGTVIRESKENYIVDFGAVKKRISKPEVKEIKQK